MASAYDEMYDSGGVVRAHYGEFERWLGEQTPESMRFKRAEAGIVLRRTDHAGALQWRMRPDGSVRHSAWRTDGVRYWHNRPGPPAEAEVDGIEEPTEPVPIEPFIAG